VKYKVWNIILQYFAQKCLPLVQIYLLVIYTVNEITGSTAPFVLDSISMWNLVTNKNKIYIN
jgi:hypothetical protein